MMNLVEKFERYLMEDGKSPKTIVSYVGDISAFVAFFESKGVKLPRRNEKILHHQLQKLSQRKSVNYDNLNRIRSSVNTTTNQQHAYDYDIRGNITKEETNYSIVPDLSIGQYKWNPLGQLESFTNSKGETYNYIYDYAGLRTKKVSGSDTTSYYYSNNNLIGEEKGTTKSQYIRGHALLAKVIDGKYYYYFYNGHGDVVQITDEAGNVVNKYTYDGWGNITNKEEKTGNSITYAGQYYDKESNLYY